MYYCIGCFYQQYSDIFSIMATPMNKLPAVFILAYSSVCHIAQADTLTGRVVRITDGDTFVVFNGSFKNKKTLQGIDSPERGQAFVTKLKVGDTP